MSEKGDVEQFQDLLRLFQSDTARSGLQPGFSHGRARALPTGDTLPPVLPSADRVLTLCRGVGWANLTAEKGNVWDS